MENNSIRCLLVDDETEGLDVLESILLSTNEVEIVAKTDASEKVIGEVIEKKPDIVFLDINMPQKSGIEILKDINRLNLNVKVIFVTAFDNFVFDALKNFAFDYLIKPIDRIELKETLIRYRQEFNKDNGYDELVSNLDSVNKIKVPAIFGSLFYSPDDIVHFEAEGAYTSIYLTSGQKEMTSCNLGKLEEKLKPKGFFRISRSALINLKYLTRLDRKSKICILTTGNIIRELDVPKKKMHYIDEQIS